MSVKSAISNSLITTGQKINIAVSRSLVDFYFNIRGKKGKEGGECVMICFFNTAKSRVHYDPS